jgi:uncharacterized protein YndB with AHSA1/START domain
MTSNRLTRREASFCFLNLIPVLALDAKKAFAGGISPDQENGISRGCECIHQEVVIRASRARIFHALTETKQFKDVTELSLPGASTEISPEVGGAFSIFGGIIVGRHIEMVPNERLVQAWRETSWDPGIYSMVRFELKNEGPGTRLIFDHTGFPKGAADHLAVGWKSHYWEPLQKYLA